MPATMKTGRPSKLTALTAERIERAVAHGADNTFAAMSAGCSVSTLSSWLRSDANLRQRVQAARDSFRRAMAEIATGGGAA